MDAADNQEINVKMVTASGDEVYFKIRRSTKISKIQGAFANKIGKDVGNIRFLYKDSRINDNEDVTPVSLEMEDGDVIDVIVDQLGG